MPTPDERADLAEIVSRLSREAAKNAPLLEAREAASDTGCLPVYADVGGMLLLAPDGEILQYDYEARSARPERDERWRRVALVSTARDFVELRHMAPVRTESDVTCTQCRGRGTLLGGDCGVCLGTGWHDKSLANLDRGGTGSATLDTE